MTTIYLSGMKFYAYHGCFAEEQKVGTRFIVDLSLLCDTSQAVQTDDVRDAVNYVAVYQTIERVMNQPVHLLETVAHKIIHEVKADFPMVEQVKVKVCKLNPPLDGQTDFVAVEMEA